jgi:SAM-dependent methyltransferase
MNEWGPDLYGDPCGECGYAWSISFDDAVALVHAIPDRYAHLLEGLDGAQRHPANTWSATEYVCHVADNLRIWGERLVGAALDGAARVAAYDENALARARSYGSVAPAAALWSLRGAARDWAEAVVLAEANGVVLFHPERGELTGADVVRSNAHDAEHHAWDIRRAVAASARPAPGESAFDRVADTYDAVRPRYPEAVFDAIRVYGALPALSRPRVLEVGVGTGQATTQMAAMGWHVVGIEPGEKLAAVARDRLAELADVSVVTATFESAAVDAERFDVVASATAWHWVDPRVGYEKAARALRPAGIIAVWWNAHVPDTDAPGWAPIRRTYEQFAPELARLARLTPDRPDYDPAAELAASGWFGEVEADGFPFSVDYSTEEFLALLDTYASHQRLEGPRRRTLYQGLARAIEDELGGTVTKPYEAVLVLGRRVGSSDA